MKQLILTLFLSSNLIILAQQNLQKNILVGTLQRSFRMYVPAMYDGTTPVPLVFNFHGYGSNAQEQEYYGDFRAIADTANFILIHPQGVDQGAGSLGWNNFFPPTATNGDYEFVSAMIDSLLIDWNINTDRIYSTGMSNGGFMSYDLACFMSHRFAAIASVTGSMVSSHLNICQPEYILPVMQIHGTNDATVGYDGTSTLLTSTPIEDLVAAWATMHQCTATAVQTAVPNTNTNDLSTAQHYVYSNATRSPVEFFKIDGGGHTWPGSAFQVPGVVTNMDFSASKEIWRFFSQYSRADLAKVPEQEAENIHLRYEPAKGWEISSSNAIQAKLQLIDMQGRVIGMSQMNGTTALLTTETLNQGVYLLAMTSTTGETLLHKRIYQP